MFIKKDMHPARKALRGTLLVLLGLSVGFFSFIVSLRISYHDRLIDSEALRDHIFTADVMQHRALAYISDDAADVEIAITLLELGFYSPIYTEGGKTLLKEKSDEGYAPAVKRFAEIFPKD